MKEPELLMKLLEFEYAYPMYPGPLKMKYFDKERVPPVDMYKQIKEAINSRKATDNSTVKIGNEKPGKG